jgi:hypothetical protein
MSFKKAEIRCCELGGKCKLEGEWNLPGECKLPGEWNSRLYKRCPPPRTQRNKELAGEWNSRLYKRCPPPRTGRSYRAKGIRGYTNDVRLRGLEDNRQ